MIDGVESRVRHASPKRDNCFRTLSVQGFHERERGKIWDEITERLNANEAFRNRLGQKRAVRDRYALLAKKYTQKMMEEERASGISPENWQKRTSCWSKLLRDSRKATRRPLIQRLKAKITTEGKRKK